MYERQTDRCKTTAERLFALSRAAQVASEQGDLKRARRFFDQALNDGVPDGGLDMLEKAARASDAGRGNRDTTLRVVLADALAAGGQGPGVSATARSALLCRAALLAHRDLGAHEKAFAWLADALVTHVDAQVLQSLNELASTSATMGRPDSVLTRALEEVFDVPSVRQLLQARAVIRKTYLQDAAGSCRRSQASASSSRPATRASCVSSRRCTPSSATTEGWFSSTRTRSCGVAIRTRAPSWLGVWR